VRLLVATVILKDLESNGLDDGSTATLISVFGMVILRAGATSVWYLAVSAKVGAEPIAAKARVVRAAMMMFLFLFFIACLLILIHTPNIKDTGTIGTAIINVARRKRYKIS